MLHKYKRLIETCTPYAVLTRQIRQYCDLEPLGLKLPQSNIYNPFRRDSDTFLNELEWLDRMTFGYAGMVMPRWVFYDCSEMPGGICGFTMPRDALPASIFSDGTLSPDLEGPMPVSMAIAIPMLPDGAWLKHTLCSINEIVMMAAPAGLRTLTFAMALRLFRVKTLYSTTQWRATELRVHTKFGELELLTAYTPGHSEPRSLTYRIEVTDERLRSALMGKDAYVDPPINVEYLDGDDVPGMIALQRDLESGRRVFVCGRPIRDGSTTWIPLRFEE